MLEVSKNIVDLCMHISYVFRWNAELPEARALPTDIKERFEGFESTGDMIERVKILINQLQA